MATAEKAAKKPAKAAARKPVKAAKEEEVVAKLFASGSQSLARAS